MQAIFQRANRATNNSRRPVFVRSLFVAVFSLTFSLLQAQDHGLYWKYKDYDGAIAVSAPGWVAKLGSLFVDEKEARKLIRKVRHARVLVFEDGSPFTAKDFKRFNRKAKRRHLDELLTVRDGKTRVQVYGKMRRNSIRKVVVFFSSPDDGAGLVSLRGKFNIDEIQKAVKMADKKNKDKDKAIVPKIIKIPVTKA